MTKLRIEIDTAKCMGQGQCNYWAPATFALGDDGIAQVIYDNEIIDSDQSIVLGAQGCPTRAISVWRQAERLV